MRTVAIIPAAGIGTRMGGAQPGSSRKQFLLLEGTPIIIHTLRKFAAAPSIERMYVAVRDEDRANLESYLARESFANRVEIVTGGDYRQESVEHCLLRLPADTQLVAVHDAVRPFVEVALIERVIEEAARTGAAIPALPPVDTVKQVERTTVAVTIPRQRIVLAQTPQVFRFDLLKQAFQRANEDGFQATDESSLVEHIGAAVSVVMGSDRNIKITKPGDLDLARLFLAAEARPQTV